MNNIMKYINIIVSIIKVLPMWVICILNCGITILDTVVLSIGQITGSKKLPVWVEKTTKKFQSWIEWCESKKVILSTYLGMK